MSTPFLGEIKIISWNFAPQSWAFCNGQFLPINQNQALFSLLGTMYGGNGQTTFALPDLQGHVPIHFGNHIQGERAGEQAHTLSLAEMAQHPFGPGRTQNATTGNGPAPNNKLWPVRRPSPLADRPRISRRSTQEHQCGNTGGSQAHLNMQPFLTLNFIIALQGIFPSRN